MIYKANAMGRPVVTATQMLESMITNPRPTRAECSDVANSVLDGTDCVMLSGESANGEYPKDAVTMLSNICIEAETILDYDATYEGIRQRVLKKGAMSPLESTASSAVKTAWDIKAKLIVVASDETGDVARHVAKYRPTVPVLVLTTKDWVARQVQGYVKNAVGKVVDAAVAGSEGLVSSTVAEAVERGWAAAGDSVVVVHGEGSSSVRVVLA